MLKGEVHLKKKQKKLLLINYSPQCHPRSKKGFWWKHSRIFLHIMHFTGNQTVQGPKASFSANCTAQLCTIRRIYRMTNFVLCLFSHL